MAHNLEYVYAMSIGEKWPFYINTGEFQKFKGKNLLFQSTEITNPDYFLYLICIASFLKASECNIHFLFKIQRHQGKFDASIKLFKSELEQLQLSNASVEVDSCEFDSKNNSVIWGQLSLLKTVGELAEFNVGFEHLGKAIHSTYCSKYSLTSDPLYPLARQGEKHFGLVKEFLANYDCVSKKLETSTYDAVLFLNGRNPSQAAAKEAAENHGMKWFAVEHGSIPGRSVHIESFQTQDRIEIQKFISRWSKSLDLPRCHSYQEESKSWLERQASNKAQNPFLKSTSSNFEDPSMDENLGTIFTSSLDEEVSCPGWSDDDIRVLIDRTIMFCNYLKKEGTTPVVAIHPNTGNRTWHDLSLILHALDKERIKYTTPWSTTSSYMLAEKSKVVATWRSTIGLELIAGNRFVILLSDSHYDILLAEYKIENNVNSNPYNEAKIQNIELAQLAIYYYSHHGIDLDSLMEGAFPAEIKKKFEAFMNANRIYSGIQKRIKKVSFIFNGYKATPNEYFMAFSLIFGPKHADRILKAMTSKYHSKYLEN